MNRSPHRAVAHVPGPRGRTPGAVAILLVGGLLVAALGPAPSAQATIDPGSIAGTVTDLADHPLPGITVSVLRLDVSGPKVVGQDETDAIGAYQIDDIGASPYLTVRFTDQNAEYATEYFDDNVDISFAVRVPIKPHSVTSGVDASLEPAATISGRLTMSTGDPVTSGQVRVWWHPPGYQIPMDTYLVDPTGYYTIPGVKSATYYLEFYDPVSGIREFWNDQPGQTSYGMTSPGSAATPLLVAACESRTGVDAVFDGPAVPAPAVTCVIPSPPAAPTVTYVVRPRVKGTLQVGQVVRVSKGVWTPTAVTLKYQWYAGRKAVTDATHRSLNVVPQVRRETVEGQGQGQGPGLRPGHRVDEADGSGQGLNSRRQPRARHARRRHCPDARD